MKTTFAAKQRHVLESLLAGRRLTVQKCFRCFGTTELRRIVSRLQKQGYPVESERVNGENFHEYYLPQWYLKNSPA